MPGSARGSTNLGYEPGALFLKFFGKFRVGATTPNWYPDTNLHFDIFQGTPNLRSDTNLRFDIFQVTPTWVLFRHNVFETTLFQHSE